MARLFLVIQKNVQGGVIMENTKRRVLIAHPTGAVRMSFASELLPIRGCVWREVGSGADMLRWLDRHSFDLLLLGTDLLGGEDLEVAITSVRQTSKNAHIPIILILPKSCDIERLEAEKKDADGAVFYEPFLDPSFKDRVPRLINRAALTRDWEQTLPERERAILDEIKKKFSPGDVRALETTVAVFCSAFDAAENGPLDYASIENNIGQMRRAAASKKLMHSVIDLSGRHADTAEHVLRMTKMATTSFASAWKLSEGETNRLAICCIPHDTGKLLLPDALINFKGIYDDAQRAQIKDHAVLGYRLLLESEAPMPVAEAALCHHMRYDGNTEGRYGSYPADPQYLRVGDDIPILARMVAVADVVDALRSARIYKEAYDPEVMFRKIKESPGHLDPDLLRAAFGI